VVAGRAAGFPCRPPSRRSARAAGARSWDIGVLVPVRVPARWAGWSPGGLPWPRPDWLIRPRAGCPICSGPGRPAPPLLGGFAASRPDWFTGARPDWFAGPRPGSRGPVRVPAGSRVRSPRVARTPTRSSVTGFPRLPVAVELGGSPSRRLPPPVWSSRLGVGRERRDSVPASPDGHSQ